MIKFKNKNKNKTEYRQKTKYRQKNKQKKTVRKGAGRSKTYMTLPLCYLSIAN